MTRQKHTGKEYGDWIVGESLGSGGQASVYRAARKAEPTKFDYAIKISNPGSSSSPGRTPEKDRARFKQEVQVLEAAKDAGCPGIVQLVDAETSPEATTLWYVMKALPAGPLRRGNRPPSFIEPFKADVDRVLEIVAAIADTLAFLHEELAYTVTHRDVKTENILLESAGGQPFLGDPGIAYIDSDDAPARAHTGYNEALGPQRWRPPELATGPGAKHNPASDIYMLGGVLYELLSGGRDFAIAVHPGGRYSHESEGFSITEVTDDPRAPHINKLLRQMFAFDPDERITAKQVAAACRAIREWSKGQPAPKWQSMNEKRAEQMRRVRELYGDDWRNRLNEELWRELEGLSAEIGVNDVNSQEGFTRRIGPAANTLVWEPIFQQHPDFVWLTMQTHISYSAGMARFAENRQILFGRSRNGRELILEPRVSPSMSVEGAEVLYETFAGDVESRRVLREKTEADLQEIDALFDKWLDTRANP